MRRNLEAKEAENVKLLHIYNDMAQEADALLGEFNEALESGELGLSLFIASEAIADRTGPIPQ